MITRGRPPIKIFRGTAGEVARCEYGSGESPAAPVNHPL
jgi:hypothetical protein